MLQKLSFLNHLLFPLGVHHRMNILHHSIPLAARKKFDCVQNS
jgi:hypothetical protein